MSINTSGIVAGVLVGGRSLRMGRPKAALPMDDGRPLVEHVVAAARRANAPIDQVVLLGRCEHLPAPLADVPVLADAEPGLGPLAGLCTLLAHAGERWALLLACDLPLLRPSLLERLCAACEPAFDAVAFRRTDRPGSWHACCALYHPRLLPAALQELNRGGRRLQGLLFAAHLRALVPAPEEERMLHNLNTPDDYARLMGSA